MGTGHKYPGYWFVLALLLVAELVSAKVNIVSMDALKPSREHRQSALIVSKVVERYHYSGVEFSDVISAQMYDGYLKALDPNKNFFMQTDVDEFNRYRLQLDDMIQRGDIDVAFVIFKRFRQRVGERITLALELLDKGEPDFTRVESYRFNREDVAWVKDRAAMDDQWRRRVKNDWLGLRLAGKADDKVVDTLRKRYENIRRRTNQVNADEVFDSFINAFTMAIEPHTAYMSPESAEDFDISMRLSLQGIGAVLRNKNEYTVVQNTIVGGPAEMSGQIKGGDRIVGVAQGKDGEMIDVIGWRLKDVVEKIRGAKGTLVRLNIIPYSRGLNTPPKEVPIVRDEIKLENKAAKSEVLENIKGLRGSRIGVITVPAFYRDFRGQSAGKKGFRSTTRDVRKLLADLEEKKVDGIIVDLRSNGGGALTEATEMTGLFIEKGPVVQVKDARGEIEVERDPDPEQVYAGPLVVLVDRNSASASEIFAGAIQDYQRGLIVGEPTFGKGTVQSLVSLNQFARSKDDLGRLRLTIAQFFRIQGGSTQNKGVMPDIVYPTVGIAGDHGESSLDNALPWASIAAVDHAHLGVGSVSNLRASSKGRVTHDPGFEFLVDQEREIKEIREIVSVSLLESERKKENVSREKRRLERLNRLRAYRGLAVLAELENADDDEQDLPVGEPEDEEGVRKIMLEEAARVLADFIEQQRPVTAQVQ